MRNKYGNRKTEIDGILFDSRKEATRYQELKLMEKAKLISDLKRQVKYVLIPKQAGERECSYIADFVYTVDGKTVVEDCKGKRTRDYIIKRKLMHYMHGIVIEET